MKRTIKPVILLPVLSLLVIGTVAALIKLGILNDYVAQILSFAGINVIIALGLNLISGFTGQLALGHAGFMAIGAYAAAISVMQFHMPILIGILIGGLVTSLFGLVIGFPTLRLRGDYLAIVTLAFGEIIRVILINLDSLTGGAAGLKGVPYFISAETIKENPDAISWVPVLNFVWITLTVVLVLALVHNLLHSSYGRAIISVREDEVASGSMGISIFRYKMIAFILSAFIAGVGGGLYAFLFNYLNPTDFNFLRSVDFLIIVVFGGMGSLTGTVVAGYLLTYLQEALRFLQDYRLVIYPLLLIMMMIFRPGGIMGTREMSIARLFRFKSMKKALQRETAADRGEQR
jgi:branched-chain amino acid transport system permease protein